MHYRELLSRFFALHEHTHRRTRLFSFIRITYLYSHNNANGIVVACIRSVDTLFCDHVFIMASILTVTCTIYIYIYMHLDRALPKRSITAKLTTPSFPKVKFYVQKSQGEFSNKV